MAQGFRILMLVVALATAPLSLAQDGTATVQFVSHNLPARLDVDQTFGAEIVLRNVGTSAWSRDNLAISVKPAGTDQGWGVTKVELSASDNIEPGETKAFAFDITAPSVPGTYPFTWELLTQGKPAGAMTPPLNIIVEDPFVRSAFVSQLIPEHIAPGEKFKVFVQYRNTGKSSWSSSQGYRLAAVAPDSAKSWGIDNVELDTKESVLPGQTATFAFTAIAPAKPGDYAFQWQLYQDGRGFFGDATPVTAVRVGAGQVDRGANLDAEFVSASLPETLKADTTYPVTLLFKNTGEEPWRAGLVTLRPQGTSGNLTWLIDRVDLAPGEVVEPGDIKAFEFNVHTPPDRGNYGFRWHLTDEHSKAFGDASEPRQLHIE